MKVSFLLGEVDAWAQLDVEAVDLVVRLAGDSLRRGAVLTEDEHVVLDRLDQLARAATAARPAAEAVPDHEVDGSCDAPISQLLTTREVGRRLNLSQRRVRALVAEGHLAGERFGRTWRFPTSVVEQLRRERECQRQ
jgi:excisionase family DNA binding protein